MPIDWLNIYRIMIDISVIFSDDIMIFQILIIGYRLQAILA